MRCSFFAAVGAFTAAVTFAAPVDKRQNMDANILQFALTLEHLESTFYGQALSKMPASMFLAAGYSQAYYDNLKYIAYDEEQHVALLTAGLSAAGATPVAACTYKFPYVDVNSFIALASILEGVGSAAYLGAAPLITSKAYLGVAGAILGTEQVHTAVHRRALGEIAPANPYLGAVTPNSAYTLAAAFITSCPSSNPALPFSAFPGLTATQGQPTSEGIPFTFMPAKAVPAGSFITFISGLSIVSVPATMISGGMLSAMIPVTASGLSFAFVTSSSVTTVTDSVVLAGPAVIEVTPAAPAVNYSAN